MSKKRSTIIKSHQDKTILDSILWLIENYLPQKKKRSSNSEFLIEKFELFTIKKLKNLASERSNLLVGDLSKTKVTFTVGNWALPYLNFLKRTKLIK